MTTRGFTLLEVVVALLVLELGVVAALGTMVVASRTLSEAERLERAVSGAEGVLDSLAGVPGPTSGSRTDAGGGSIEWVVTDSMELTLRVLGPAGEVAFEIRSLVGPAPTGAAP